MREVVREPREHHRDRDDADGLAPLAQPEVPAGAHAEVVVEEPDRAQPDDQHDQRPARARERDRLVAEVRDHVAEDRRPDDREARPSSAYPPWPRAGARSARRRGSAGRSPGGGAGRSAPACAMNVAEEGRRRGHEHRDHRAAPRGARQQRRRQPSRGRRPGSPSRAPRRRPRPARARYATRRRHPWLGAAPARARRRATVRAAGPTPISTSMPSSADAPPDRRMRRPRRSCRARACRPAPRCGGRSPRCARARSSAASIEAGFAL